jgi:hypothetical protein
MASRSASSIWGGGMTFEFSYTSKGAMFVRGYIFCMVALPSPAGPAGSLRDGKQIVNDSVTCGGDCTHRTRASRRERKSGPQRQPAPVAALRFSVPRGIGSKSSARIPDDVWKRAAPTWLREGQRSAPGAAVSQFKPAVVDLLLGGFVNHCLVNS